MNINRFIRNFLSLRQALQTQNFSTKELNSLCMQGAIEYEKLYLEEARFSLEEAKLALESMQMKAKINLDKCQLELLKAQILNTLIQAQSMLKSLKDNVAINRANAYVSFLQVVGNASNASGVAQHADNVVRTINKIGLDQAPSPLEEPLNRLSAQLNQIGALESMDSIEICAQSLETLPNHPLKVWGYTTLFNPQESFLVDGKLHSTGNSMLFSASVPKSYTITYIAHNPKARLEKSLNILVSAQEMPILP
ncbi:hypothetical protein [Helicobacter sp. L8]|uniref:hypothetical protein n=1 Tax=Helicobacter sp. L8 TaxID=2316078 RepID=UPI000EB52DDF|nr:hypothetical protein [Helicobacter sp. L8]